MMTRLVFQSRSEVKDPALDCGASTKADLSLEFRKQGFPILPLPLCIGELWRVDRLPGCRANSSMWIVRKRNAPLEQ
jgi:hypothetical protein